LQSYYQFAFLIDPAVLKEGINHEAFLAAVRAEGVGCSPGGWGAVMYRQKLWSIPESMYRVSSSEKAQEIIANRLGIIGHTWLMLSEDEISKTADAFEKVMSVYRR
jgi:hypothetical protein